MDVRLRAWGRQCHRAKVLGAGESFPRCLGPLEMLQQPRARSVLGCVGTNPEPPCWAGFYQAQIKGPRLPRVPRWIRRTAMSCRGARTRCSSKVLPTVQGEGNSSVSGLALAEISKHNLKKHYHNCMFAGKGKNNQKKKDKTSRERKFISKHLRECYKQ